MRITYLLTAGALAIAAPGFAQTPGRTPLPAEPTATPTPDTGSTPAPPVGAGAPATPDASAAAPAASAAPATPANTTPIGPSIGATVYGAAGTPVGTIKDMDAQYVTLATSKGEVKLPIAGVGPGLKGPVIGLTAEQLDAAVTQAQAAQPAAAATPTTKSRKKTR